MSGRRGIVLLNALVMVAAISAVAAALLSRAETSIARSTAHMRTTQLRLYLDATEHLVELLLEADADDNDIDHTGEVWARSDYDLPIDRGRAGGRIVDLQGRFNLNWLTDPEDNRARAAFRRLARAQGLSRTTTRGILQFLAPGGPVNRAAYLNASVPVSPRGGPLRTMDRLRLVPGLTGPAHSRLADAASVIPPDTALNVNTASEQVLAVFLPRAGQNALRELVEERALTPFASVADFLERAERRLGAGVIETLDPERLTVSSRWFEARLVVAIEESRLARRLILSRSEDDGTVALTLRVPVAQ